MFQPGLFAIFPPISLIFFADHADQRHQRVHLRNLRENYLG
jgi:hypothetical protein